MTIEQMVEIPASHRLTIDIPPEMPAGQTRVIIHFPVPAKGQSRGEGFRQALQRAYGAWGDNPSEDGVAIVRAMRDEWDHLFLSTLPYFLLLSHKVSDTIIYQLYTPLCKLSQYRQ